MYNSIRELAAEAFKRPSIDCHFDASIETGRGDFYGDLTFDEAVEIGLNGGHWESGCELVNMAVKSIDNDRHQNKPRYKAAYAGARPSVPRYLAGAARTMITRASAPTINRVITIGINVSRSWQIDQEEAINRGAAILSAVHSLEQTGDRVEVYAVWRAASEDHKKRSDVRVLIKPADAFFSASDIAFPLGHVAFQRRLIWAVAEQQAAAGDTTIEAVLDSSYGQNIAETDTDFDIYFERQIPATHWESPVAALEYVEKKIGEELCK